MPAQWVEIVRIGGAAARHVANEFSRWASARTTDDPNEWGDEQWPTSVHEQVDGFIERVRDHAHSPPVLYYCRYVDLWSSGYVFDDLHLPRPIIVHTRLREVCCHDLEHTGSAIRSSLAAELSEAHFAPENVWYLHRMHEAMEAWDVLDPNGVIVTVREVFRGAYEDREIEASLQVRPEWL